MTILTDDERPKLPEKKRLGSDHTRSGIYAYTAEQMKAYALDHEAAVLAKLAQQEPVAWIGPTNLEWLAQSPENRMPLYTHPALQQADKAQNEFNRVIQHAITLGSEAAQFLRCWNEGNWNGCREFDFEPALPYEIEGEADRQRVPEGHVLVPVEPTCDMLAAMSGEWHPSRHGKAREQYAALLAAAPEAPAQASAVDERAAFEAELRHLHALNDELTKAYRKMYNAAAGYSNYCEDSASVRRCDRDFEEADAMFRAALAQKCCKNTT